MNKLPPLQTIKHALKAVFQFRNAGTRIALSWILILTVVRIFDHYFSGAANSTGDPAGIMTFQPTEVIIAAFSVVIFSSIAVNWHRYILLDEVTPSEKIFRLDRLVWNYAGRTVLIMLVTLVPVIIFSTAVLAVLPNLRIALFVPLIIAGIYIMRLSVALPAIALERKDFGITAALQVTRGNNLQFAALLGLNALIFIATLLLTLIVLSIAGSVSELAAKILAVVLSVPISLFLSLFSVSLLSSLYGFFVEKRKF
jgi:hypothetical protein